MFGTERNCIFKLEKETYVVACEYSRFSQLLTTWDVLPEGISVTQQQKFYTDEVKSVLNGQELCLVDIVVILFYLLLRSDRQKTKGHKGPCELRLFWYLTRALNQSVDCRPTVGQHLANKLLTCCQQSANCWQKIFVKGGKRQSADSWPTVGRLLADSRPTVGQQSADSFLGELFFIFKDELKNDPSTTSCP